MEPTPELEKIARELIGPGATDTECFVFTHALMTQAAELRMALEPFERAAQFSPAVKVAVDHAQTSVERLRRTDEALAQRIGADKPAYVPKQSWLQRAFSWVRK